MENKNHEAAAPQKRQKYLGDKGLIVFIAFLTAFIPLSTDLYMPALPQLAKSFHASTGLMNLTLVFFFIFNAAGTLVIGPFSDKYGRKKILLIGIIIYTAGSVFCAVTSTIWPLIFSRIIQAVGSGAIISVSMALVKDAYSGKKRESILAVTQSISMLAPIIAPIIGAFLLNITSWRGIFWALAVIGFIALAGGIAFEETIDQMSDENIIQAIGKLGSVLKNRSFTKLLITFSLVGIPMMGYISASSYIYENGFRLSAQAYSFYFSANAVVGIFGPLLYVVLSKFIKSDKLITISFIVTCASGLLMCTIGNLQPWLFALSVIPNTLAGGLTRPPSTSLMLDQQKGDTGALCSVMSCGFTVFGSIGMLLLSMEWANRIIILGSVFIITGLASLVLWIRFLNKNLACDTGIPASGPLHG